MESIPTGAPEGRGRFRPPDFDRAPMLVLWEITRACELACTHCRAQAAPGRDPEELGTDEAKRLLESMKEMGVPLVVLTGGDPLLREDVHELIRHGCSIGLRMAMTPSATPRLTPAALDALQEAGLSRLALSLDSADPATHDGMRGVPGTFVRTLALARHAREIGLSLQINTTVTKTTLPSLGRMPELLDGLGIDLWSVFFLVPVGRGAMAEVPSIQEQEAAFEIMWQAACRGKYAVKGTEAPHYRRYALQKKDPRGRPPTAGVNDGNGIMFIDHRGEVFPSGFLPLTVGNVRQTPVAELYRDSPLFKKLREPALYWGKCGACEFKTLCGGSRARAYAYTGDPLGEEPCCGWIPHSMRGERPEPVMSV